jgi:hypothetical protein
MKSFPTLTALLAAATLTGCPSRPTTPAPPTEVTRLPPVNIPPGCEADLSGQYVHAQRPDWTYAAIDDGGTLALRLGEQTDGGVEILLQRTPDGFLGTTRATALAAQGVECEVRFPTELVGCPDGGLLISSVESVSVNEACVPAKVSPDAPREQHLLVPLQPGALPADGGTPAPMPD